MAVKTERLEARVSTEQKELFSRAAALQGRSLTDFVVASVHEAAIEVVRDQNVLRLSERDRQQFVSALLNVPAPTEALVQAVRQYRKGL